MKTPSPALTLAARNTANAGHGLVEALRESLPETDRAKFEAYELTGAEVAVTVKWSANRCELRVGVVSDDSEPECILSLNFPRVAPAAAH